MKFLFSLSLGLIFISCKEKENFQLKKHLASPPEEIKYSINSLDHYDPKINKDLAGMLKNYNESQIGKYADTNAIICIAEQASGNIIGGAKIRIYGDLCILNSLTVDKNKEDALLVLMKKIKIYAKQEGCKRIFLDSYDLKTKYESLGFKLFLSLPQFIFSKYDLNTMFFDLEQEKENSLEESNNKFNIKLIEEKDFDNNEEIIKHLDQKSKKYKESIIGDFKEHYNIFFFATKESDNEILGGAKVYIYADVVYVSSLVLKEELEGKGVGRVLMQQIEKYAKSKACKNIFLYTEEFQAKGFYEKNGFEEIAYIPNYFLGYGTSIMLKDL